MANRPLSHISMIELDITWDGNVPGLAEHRLSIGSFSPSLRALLMAIRRTASNMLREASDKKEVHIGRHAGEADRIDIQISALIPGSTGLQNVVSVYLPPGQASLWPGGLAEEALDRVLHDIERESKDIHRNAGVRDYFKSLPPGITKHDYVLRVDGQTKREVHLGAISIAEELSGLPYLIEIRGRVIGVGFEPGKNFVRIKSSAPDGSETTFSSTKEQVDQALELREGDVRVLALAHDGGKRMLRIQRRDTPLVKLDEETYVFKRWAALLARLAQ